MGIKGHFIRIISQRKEVENPMRTGLSKIKTVIAPATEEEIGPSDVVWFWVKCLLMHVLCSSAPGVSLSLASFDGFY